MRYGVIVHLNIKNGLKISGAWFFIYDCKIVQESSGIFRTVGNCGKSVVKCGGKIKHGGIVPRLSSDFILVLKLSSCQWRWGICSCVTGLVLLCYWFGMATETKKKISR